MSAPESAPPKLHDREIAEANARFTPLGYVLATRCIHCGAPLFDARSLAAKAGPVCRRRHENDPGAHSAKNAATGAAETIPTT